jgi:hypothetical protein
MRQRGAILLMVLASLAILALLGAQAARFAAARQREAGDAWCRELLRAARDDRRGGQAGEAHATIRDGANGASHFEGFHGSQAFSPGRDDCIGRRARGGG